MENNKIKKYLNELNVVEVDDVSTEFVKGLKNNQIIINVYCDKYTYETLIINLSTFEKRNKLIKFTQNEIVEMLKINEHVVDKLESMVE